MTSLAEQASAATGAVGRYFSLVSSLPSLLFAAYLFALVRSGAWSGPVDFRGVVTEDWWADAILVSVLSFATAVAFHPLQFQLIRLLEGYWGTSRLGRDLAVLRIRYHRQRLLALMAATRDAEEVRDSAAAAAGQGPRNTSVTAAALGAAVTVAEGTREHGNYPPDLERVLPTRLGNVLRSDEDRSGRAYGLSVIETFPRIALIAPPGQLEYAQDQRLQMELAVRVAFLGLLAAVVTVCFMWWHGAWILLSLVPYGIAYLSYRGAVVLAGIYGSAVAAVVELNRFALYEQFHLPHPESTIEERKTNAALITALRHDPLSRLKYERPPRPQ
jgi:hypothetical protein